MSLAKRLALLWLVLIACVGCDQTTKSVALSHFGHAGAWSYLGDTVRLQLAHNHGGFLSLGASLSPVWRHLLFDVCVGSLLLGLLGHALYSERISAVRVFATSLLIAGGVGNLLDRTLCDGNVVDFINLGFGPLRTGIFNVSDMVIVAGIVLLLADGFHRHRVAMKFEKAD
jgi:signal peptidase II